MNYSDKKAIPGEVRFIEFDEEFQMFGVFGEDSGFCYGLHHSEEEAFNSDEYSKKRLKP